MGGEDRVVSGATEGGSIGTIRGGLWKLTGNEWGGGGGRYNTKEPYGGNQENFIVKQPKSPNSPSPASSAINNDQ